MVWRPQHLPLGARWHVVVGPNTASTTTPHVEGAPPTHPTAPHPRPPWQRPTPPSPPSPAHPPNPRSLPQASSTPPLCAHPLYLRPLPLAPPTFPTSARLPDLRCSTTITGVNSVGRKYRPSGPLARHPLRDSRSRKSGRSKRQDMKTRFTCRRRRCLPPSSPFVLKGRKPPPGPNFPIGT